jgi:arginase
VRIVVLAVPYDAGHRSVGVGLGPARLLEAGVANVLRAAGHDVRVVTIELPSDIPRHEIARTIAAARVLAAEMQTARRHGELPIVLAGNCSTAVGTLAGCPRDTAVVWFDAHADLNTAETTTTGMLDGLALSMVTGRALCGMTESVDGFMPLDLDRVTLVGARDLDPPEAALLAGGTVRTVPVDSAAGGVGQRLREMGSPPPPVYVHLDLDVIDPAHARANQYAAPGGLAPAALLRTLGAIVATAPLYALAITAYDPVWDRDGRMRQVALDAVNAVVPRSTTSE